MEEVNDEDVPEQIDLEATLPPFFKKLGAEDLNMQSQYIPKIIKPRERFDTNEEMELLGQCKFGEGNQPIISEETNNKKLKRELKD